MLNKLLSIAILLTSTTALAALNDEVIFSSKKWEANLVSQHPVWEKPACVSQTVSEDGLSTLEVVAFYDEANDSFLEPEVNVITPFDVSFLDIEVKTNGSSAKKYTLLPILPNDVSLVGARAMFDDRKALVRDLKNRNTLTVRYMDTAGEVKSILFSLSGSSKTISAQFDEDNCDLSFNELPEALPVIVELP